MTHPEPAVRPIPHWVTAVGVLMVLAIIALFFWVGVSVRSTTSSLKTNQANTLAVLGEIKKFTDPSSAISRANNADIKGWALKIEACIENHEDRLAAQARGLRPPAVKDSCAL